MPTIACTRCVVSGFEAESSDKVVGVRLRAVANAKVIDDETERNVECVMSEETGCGSGTGGVRV